MKRSLLAMDAGNVGGGGGGAGGGGGGRFYLNLN